MDEHISMQHRVSTALPVKILGPGSTSRTGLLAAWQEGPWQRGRLGARRRDQP